MPPPSLVREFNAAQDRYRATLATYTPLLVRMALATVADALPTAAVLETLGELNEDWAYTLRIQRVLDERGTVLWPVGAGDDATDDAISAAEMDYLDVLLDLTGENYFGRSTLDRSDLTMSR